MTVIQAAQDLHVPTRGRVLRFKLAQQTPPRHEFLAAICREDEEDGGGYAVFAVHYPGVLSQGETIEEAKANIGEAFLAMLEARRKHGEDLAYSASPTVDLSLDCQQVWISVDG